MRGTAEDDEVAHGGYCVGDLGGAEMELGDGSEWRDTQWCCEGIQGKLSDRFERN